GRAIIPLRRIPKDAGDGGEHYEAIEREILCALVQQPCAIRLWRHHGPQALAVERGKRRVVDDHREVKYATKRLIARADFREQSGNIFGGTSVGAHHLRVHTAVPQALDPGFRCWCCRATATAEH